ncbi:TPA: aminotransferase class I/II-fold pyridoxal phosphate-dependent enzyme [Klebsiella pneumoniae]|nr:aminotransferase class I/II-fold pyridoxal phosphate-dependent enzyme [Klebsiella pneumoniae]
MPDFTASPLVDALEENLFSLLEKLAAEVNTEALPLIDLSSGSPDQPTPPEVIDSLQSAIHRRENHGYPSFWGKPQVREAIARFYRRQYDVELDPHSEIAVFQGSHIGIGGIPRALLSPGQYLISTDPCYPIYRSAALQSQAAFYGLPLRAENHFLPDFNDLPREVADKAGLVVLNYPHNPTGALATPALFASALQFARRHQVPILHDFAYAAIGSAASDAPLSLFSQPDAKAWGVETYTFSKTFNMAGWRFGFAVGNASIIRAFKKLHTHSYSTVFGAIQDAAIAALNLPAERIAQLTAVYHQRREWVLRRLAALRWPAERIAQLTAVYHQRREWVLRRLAALRWPARDAQGTFFLWLGVPPGYRSQEFARLLLQEAHILVAPGTGFGEGGEGFIRISLTAGDEALSNALDRLARLALF